MKLIISLCLTACINSNRIPFTVSCQHMGQCIHMATQHCEGKSFLQVSQQGFVKPFTTCNGTYDPQTETCSGNWTMMALCDGRKL